MEGHNPPVLRPGSPPGSEFPESGRVTPLSQASLRARPCWGCPGQGCPGQSRCSECPEGAAPPPACFKALRLCGGLWGGFRGDSGLTGEEGSGAEPGGDLEPRAGEPGLGLAERPAQPPGPHSVICSHLGGRPVVTSPWELDTKVAENTAPPPRPDELGESRRTRSPGLPLVAGRTCWYESCSA